LGLPPFASRFAKQKFFRNTPRQAKGGLPLQAVGTRII
jgi:hypothetical protein